MQKNEIDYLEEKAANKKNDITYIEMFRQLPHFTKDMIATDEFYYAPHLYRVEKLWNIGWIKCYDHNEMIEEVHFYGNTPQEVIKNAYDYCVKNGHIKRGIIRKDEKKIFIKPFDIELVKAGKQVCTSDGRNARIVCFKKKGKYPIVALIENSKNETVDCFKIDGKYMNGKDSNTDLMLLYEIEK